MIAKAGNYNVAAILRFIRLCKVLTLITEKLNRTIKASATFSTSCVCTLINNRLDEIEQNIVICR